MLGGRPNDLGIPILETMVGPMRLGRTNTALVRVPAGICGTTLFLVEQPTNSGDPRLGRLLLGSVIGSLVRPGGTRLDRLEDIS